MTTMAGGSDDARPPQGGKEAVDDAWNALIDEAEGEENVVRERAPPPVSGPHTAVGTDRLADPDGEMAILMSGAADKSLSGPVPAATLEDEDEGSATKASAPSTIAHTHGKFVPPGGAPRAPRRPEGSATAGRVQQRGPDPDAPRTAATPKPAAPRSHRAANAGQPDEISTQPESPAADTTTKGEPQRPGRPALRVVDGGSSPEPEPQAEPPRPARASRPVEPAPEPSPPPPTKGPPWAWIAVGTAVVAAIGIVALARMDSTRPTADRSDEAVSAGKAGKRVSPEPAVSTSSPPQTDRTEPAVDDAGSRQSDGADDAADPDLGLPSTRSGDPREPPPGTPPEIAAVFRRLPVSPSDGPPIGGIGASGIHIDELQMGSTMSGGMCSGHTDDFSIATTDRASVCVRVVHPREKDELQVLWQKHGGSTRRSKMVVGAKHAYRTRGYLKLRGEYIGDWTVRILSSDGVELAHHEFTIVP